MSALSSWQKITRVLPGQPFGDGKDGAYTSTTIPTIAYKSCSGTADSATLSADTDSSPFTVGDLLLLHQTRGTGVGQWEINRVTAVGSDEYTLAVALKYTYTDSGASQAQAVKIPRYTSMSIASGTWTVTSWDGDVGGIIAIACKGTASLANTITVVGKGHSGGASQSGGGSKTGYQGSGSVGAGTTAETANGTGGGGGSGDHVGNDAGGAGGGGGGNGAAGTAGTQGGSGSNPGGTAGTSGGASDLTTMVFGGAGGGGGTDNSDTSASGAGANGGGIIVVMAKTITVTGAMTLTGNTGSNGELHQGGGGGGAGGSALLVCQTGTLGSSLITASGGSGGSATGEGTDGGGGGAGAVGRITVHHLSTVTGTTSPTFTDVSDTTLIETNPGVLELLI